MMQFKLVMLILKMMMLTLVLMSRVNQDPAVAAEAVRVEDVSSKVRMQIGDLIERDCLCDSKHMLVAMDKVGKAVRDAHHWVPRDSPCYVVMDDAGGHGTETAIDECENSLREKCDIEIIFQVPRSPCANLLDLRVWCSL